MILVEIRCKARGCGRLLATVDDLPEPHAGDRNRQRAHEMAAAAGLGAPAGWRLRTLEVAGCPRHRRIDGASWGQMVDRAPDLTIMHRIDHDELRPLIEKSRHTGKTQVYVV